MFYHTKLNPNITHYVPINLKDGSRMKHIIAVDTKVGYFLKIKVDLKGQPLIDRNGKEVLYESGIIPEGILIRRIHLNQQGDNLLH